MVKRYPSLNQDNSKQGKIFKESIDKVICNTEDMENGKLRIKVVELVYFKKTHTLTGAALEVNVSMRTAQRWTTTFVNSVGKAAGF